ncbi:hypothetical protein L484_014147 [Morus notabilis]|uniref:Transcription repressor n=1 Tax=Morus notabilis TaxID=981085 RepID=W9RY16_9ROSA|nr:hypothetical protein L484_014147 [Morus notabilis]
MKTSSHRQHKKTRQDQQLQQRCGRALCCSCRLSVSSSEEAESSSSSDRFPSVSSLAHAMVQERLDQMIREKQEARHNNNNDVVVGDQRRRHRSSHEVTTASTTKFVLMVAMEKCSDDPREDFRESMVEMIMANRIEEPKDLRTLLNYYVSMNSEEYHGDILEVFHQQAPMLFGALESTRMTRSPMMLGGVRSGIRGGRDYDALAALKGSKGCKLRRCVAALGVGFGGGR